MEKREVVMQLECLDLEDFLGTSSSRRLEFIDGVGRSLHRIGFFTLKNHGMDPDLVRASYGLCSELFTLPKERKQRYEDESLKGQRGYVSFGKEHAKDQKASDLKEFWHVGRSRYTSKSPYIENIWPEEVPAFRPMMEELYAQLDRCSGLLLRACALYLGEKEELFSEMAVDGNSILRLIHYPPIEAHWQGVRAAAHEDINLITLLCEASDSGLEVQTHDGTWLAIDALKGQIVVDSGDMLANISNGFYRATTHRVVNPKDSTRARYSIPFFCHPRSECNLTPLASCKQKTGGVDAYPAITAGEFLEKRLREIGL